MFPGIDKAVEVIVAKLDEIVKALDRNTAALERNTAAVDGVGAMMLADRSNTRADVFPGE